jgi:hypothetical protein
LGFLVDPESTNQASADALGDDNDESDDEDGVVFPPLVPGTQVTIPVEVTSEDISFGYLYGWMDWNQDGDFEDEGESIVPQNTSFFATGTINLEVDIPENALIGQTFARFRVGPYNPDLSPFGSSDYGEVEDYRVTLLSTLPIELTDFRGNHQGSYNLLSWETAREFNSVAFIVERRFGEEGAFRGIAELRAAGQSMGLRQYAFKDAAIEREGVYYYRLNQVSEDGGSQFSPVVGVLVNRSAGGYFSLYPNPAKNRVSLHLNEPFSGQVEIQLLNGEGKRLMTDRIRPEHSSAKSYSLDLGGISEGTYFVRVIDEGRVFSERLVVTR